MYPYIKTIYISDSNLFYCGIRSIIIRNLYLHHICILKNIYCSLYHRHYERIMQGIISIKRNDTKCIISIHTQREKERGREGDIMHFNLLRPIEYFRNIMRSWCLLFVALTCIHSWCSLSPASVLLCESDPRISLAYGNPPQCP